MKELDGKVAVITGAGSGMGRASAVRFVEQGARVVVADVSGAEQHAADDLGASAVPVHCDVSVEDDVVAMFATAIREFGRVDAVLNVAGVFGSIGHGLADTDMSEYDAILDVDLRGVVHGTKYGIRAMEEHGGTILNWSSLAGLNATLRTGVYSAAKAGVIAITKAAAAEYGNRGIRANAICPGIILSQDVEARGDALTPEMRAAIAEQSAKPALGRAGRADEVADLAAFLVSDRASYITGSVVTIDGGWSCKLP